ncbi:unnamed protein product [Rhodiola kirilowii]
MAAAKLRSCCSFHNLLLNLFLFILSSASLAPILILRIPPTPIAYVFLLVSCISILSSFMGFYSQSTHFCFVTHISLLLGSSLAQLLGFMALFWRERSCLEMLKSSRDTREAKALVRLECGVLMCILVLHVLILVVSCVVHSLWVREYEGLAAEKRSRRMVRVQQEEQVVSSKELDGRVKTDFEG